MGSTPIRFAEMQSQFEAVRAGMGVSLLPCLLGDADPMLIRVPGSAVSHIGDVWLLTHGDTRRTKRVRLLCDQVRTAIQGFTALIDQMQIALRPGLSLSDHEAYVDALASELTRHALRERFDRSCSLDHRISWQRSR